MNQELAAELFHGSPQRTVNERVPTHSINRPLATSVFATHEFDPLTVFVLQITHMPPNDRQDIFPWVVELDPSGIFAVMVEIPFAENLLEPLVLGLWFGKQKQTQS
ncbi:hypothetical protein [Rhodopirellula sp. P2]|uniref:hypothetical protein n=1 Tax=Rhodopirellula sp. P2 TaxID=2127060 RepID=UPI0023687BC4|nr:hypothetical protein [Rhodopirellula sp. P2]WDQ16339.1 hypothetical protein PSR62_22330 [Rhodopirellula sp. P2]